MKPRKRLILILICISNLYGQSDNLGLNYFPVHVGDFWQYRYYRTSYFGGSTEYFYTKEVISDTIMQDSGYLYYQIRTIKPSSTQDSYLRLDSLSGIVYAYGNGNPDAQVYILSSFPGDTVTSGYIHSSTDYLPVLEDSVIVKTFSNSTGNLPYSMYRLAHSFGQSATYFSDSETTISTNMVYAQLQGTEFGAFVVSIDNDSKVAAPQSFNFNVFPNPFNDQLTIELLQNYTSPTEISIYGITGREIMTLPQTYYYESPKLIKWNTTLLPSGTYFIVIRSENVIFSKRATLLK